MFDCDKCQRSFGNQYNLLKHQKGKKCNGSVGTVNGRFKCPHCPSLFARHDGVKRHVERVHANNLLYGCGVCTAYFSQLDELRKHRESEHEYCCDFTLVKSAHGRQSQRHRLFFPDTVSTVDEAYIFSRNHMQSLLETTLLEQPRFKVNFVLGLEMYKTDEEGLCTALEMFSFRCDAINMTSFVDTDAELDNVFRQFDSHISEFLFQGLTILWIVI